MFCAGLLLSIADLLTYRTAYRTLDRKPRTKTSTHFHRLGRQSKFKTTACSRGPSAQPETRGDIRWPRFAFLDRKHHPQAPSPEVSFEYDTASLAPFQPRTAENLSAHLHARPYWPYRVPHCVLCGNEFRMSASP